MSEYINLDKELTLLMWDEEHEETVESITTVKDILDTVTAEGCPTASVMKPNLDMEFVKLTVRESNGRPYYSIIYLEDGHDFEGFSSYSLDVISSYLKEYFGFAHVGHWIEHGSEEGHLIEKYSCSECNWDAGTKKTRFCPSCGADMREKTNG